MREKGEPRFADFKHGRSVSKIRTLSPVHGSIKDCSRIWRNAPRAHQPPTGSTPSAVMSPCKPRSSMAPLATLKLVGDLNDPE